MRIHRSFALILTVAALGATSSLQAQSRSAVTSAQLEAAVAATPAPRAEAVRQLMSSEQAQKVAGQLGISAAELAVRTASLDNATLNQMAEQSGLGDPTLAGGADNVVISTTAIIIVLLILILLAT